MSERFILIAEDDNEALESWGRDIKDFNAQQGREHQFIAQFAKSKRSALAVLDRVRINCAVIDLRLPDDDSDVNSSSKEPLGNNVLEQILLQVGVPAVVYSGHLVEVSDTVKASKIHRIQKQGGGAMKALEWLSEHESLMSAMEETHKSIAKESAQLFSQYIWPRWENEWKNLTDPSVLGGVLTRQTATHISEVLTLPPQLCHPEEFYLVPPIRERLSTGDLVTVEAKVYVIVTPRCNMARDEYPNNLMLAYCKPMGADWTGLRERFNGAEKSKNSATRALQDMVCQSVPISSHFLAPCGDKGPWMVDFKEIFTLPSSEATALLKSRFATIAPQFVPNLVQRYAAYLGRVGQPDLDSVPLRDQICK
jgi:hypothetical protein